MQEIKHMIYPQWTERNKRSLSLAYPSSGEHFQIAIAEDDYTAPNGLRDSSSPLWAQILREKGHCVSSVCVSSLTDLLTIQKFDGFMGRWAHFNGMARIARRLLPTLEMYRDIACFPNWRTCWHYDDKISQSYILTALCLPHVRTEIFFDCQRAIDFVNSASFPCVLKLSSGAGSANVVLIKTRQEAKEAVLRLFQNRFTRLPQNFPAGESPFDERKHSGYEAQSGYVLLQRFVPDNAGDIRITIVGDTAYGFIRKNRPHDFRASGSGLIDYDPKSIPVSAVRLAFDAASRLGTQSAAFDILLEDGEPLIVEFSYTYVVGALDACPGQWIRRGDALEWRSGTRQVENDHVEVFLADMQRVNQKQNAP